MEVKDSKSIEKSNYKQLTRNLKTKAYLIWGNGWEGKLAGILMEDTDASGLVEKQKLQEYHNSGHALWFLSMAVYGVIENKPDRHNPEKTNRILGHLICLREFIPQEKGRLRIITKKLSEAILAESPDNRTKWLHFLYQHWFLIRSFAKYYGSDDESKVKYDDKCFPMELYDRVRDVYLNQHYFKSWWWRMKISQFVRRLRFWSLRLNKLFQSRPIVRETGREITQ